MQYHIRRAKEKDAEDILRLLGQIAQLHHEKRPDIFKSNASKYNNKLILEKIKRPEEYITVAVDETDKVAGYLFCVFDIVKNHPVQQDREILYLDDLCVDEDKRGSGIGSLLINHAYEYAKKEHCDAVELNAWEINERAVKFYADHGFTVKYRRMELIVDSKNDLER